MEILSIFYFRLFIILWQIFLFSWIIFLIIASIDIAKNKFEDNNKTFWLLLCLFVPFGWLIYFLIGRKQRIKV